MIVKIINEIIPFLVKKLIKKILINKCNKKNKRKSPSISRSA